MRKAGRAVMSIMLAASMVLAGCSGEKQNDPAKEIGDDTKEGDVEGKGKGEHNLKKWLLQSHWLKTVG